MRRVEKNRWAKVAFFCAVLAYTGEAQAREATWVPRIGSLTTEQTTEIRLISQEITLFDLRQLTLGEKTVWAFDVKAVFQFRNTTKTKKKPTFLFPLCTLNERFQPGVSCQLDKTDLRIKVDGQKMDISHAIKGNEVSARFSLKFGPKAGRKVELSYRIFERSAGETRFRSRASYATFDYHLEDSGRWSGPVGATRFAVRLPFQADQLNAHLFSTGKRFTYRHRHAFYEKRKLTPGDDDRLSFYIAIPAYKNKIDILKKRVKAQPKSIKRRIALMDLLSVYPGAKEELEKHVAVVLRDRFDMWDASKQTHAARMYSEFLLESHRFEDEGTACDATVCVESQMIDGIIEGICDKDTACTASHRKRLSGCCNVSPQS